jgi:hypothetical protein
MRLVVTAEDTAAGSKRVNAVRCAIESRSGQSPGLLRWGGYARVEYPRSSIPGGVLDPSGVVAPMGGRLGGVHPLTLPPFGAGLAAAAMASQICDDGATLS